jgi:hypothetical protein
MDSIYHPHGCYYKVEAQLVKRHMQRMHQPLWKNGWKNSGKVMEKQWGISGRSGRNKAENLSGLGALRAAMAARHQAWCLRHNAPKAVAGIGRLNK